MLHFSIEEGVTPGHRPHVDLRKEHYPRWLPWLWLRCFRHGAARSVVLREPRKAIAQFPYYAGKTHCKAIRSIHRASTSNNGSKQLDT